MATKRILNKGKHIQYIGKVTSNYYPSSSKIYITKTTKGFVGTEAEAEHYADVPEDIPEGAIPLSERKNSYASLRNRLYKNGKTNCHICGEYVEKCDASIEHIIPLSKGGSNLLDNLSISHRKCNELRGNSFD
jgi:5-methylcytosine-specific restriction endonuclease McrA